MKYLKKKEGNIKKMKDNNKIYCEKSRLERIKELPPIAWIFIGVLLGWIFDTILFLLLK